MSEKKILKQYMRKDTIFRCMDKIRPGSLKKSAYYGKRIIMQGEECQELIAEKLTSGEPFMAARYGSVELRCMVEYEEVTQGIIKDYCEKTYGSMPNNAGFFPPTKEYFEKFAKCMRESSAQADVIGIWFNRLENYYVDTYAKDAQLVRLNGLEPYYFNNPWTKALQGKKVLVVHPFAESIKNQYEKRELLFENPDILPEFELITYKAIQTVGGEDLSNFTSWFDALDMMYEDIQKIEYDVAILGCGAYGFPLAARMKADGKQAIHMGGATQILFGIKGKRWDEHPVISKLYNAHWIRPMQTEQTQNFQKIEQGCYW